MPTHDHSRCLKLRKILQFISVGKYVTGLYYKKQDSQSSSFGGLLTLLIAFFFLVYSVITIDDIFQEYTINLSSYTNEFERFVWVTDPLTNKT